MLIAFQRDVDWGGFTSKLIGGFTSKLDIMG